MSPKPPKKSRQHLLATDLRAAAQLATQATQAVTAISEGLHQSVWSSLGVPGGDSPAQTGGLTGLIYQSINGVTALIGRGLDHALTRLEPVLQNLLGQTGESPERVAVIAALNGVMGDRLVQQGNPLALPMTLRHQDRALSLPLPATPAGGHLSRQIPDAAPKLLLMIHGLCMTDLQWNTEDEGRSLNHGEALAAQLGYTPVYLRYNTGLHVSQNGRALATQLETLVRHWPVALQDLSVLAHSMGGLVIRSALFYARQAGMAWPERLKNILFLGTPHHGAPLERWGNWVDEILGSTPYSRPFAKLGQLRSAGVTDLRYGHVLDVDWQGHDRFRRRADSRQPVPLPAQVACFTVAATAAPQRGSLYDRLLGDGLVPLPSALGQHENPARCLAFAKDHQYIVYRSHHLQLLNSPAVTKQLLLWLSPTPLL